MMSKHVVRAYPESNRSKSHSRMIHLLPGKARACQEGKLDEKRRNGLHCFWAMMLWRKLSRAITTTSPLVDAVVTRLHLEKQDVMVDIFNTAPKTSYGQYGEFGKKISIQNRSPRIQRGVCKIILPQRGITEIVEIESTKNFYPISLFKIQKEAIQTGASRKYYWC